MHGSGLFHFWPWTVLLLLDGNIPCWVAGSLHLHAPLSLGGRGRFLSSSVQLGPQQGTHSLESSGSIKPPYPIQVISRLSDRRTFSGEPLLWEAAALLAPSHSHTIQWIPPGLALLSGKDFRRPQAEEQPVTGGQINLTFDIVSVPSSLPQ